MHTGVFRLRHTILETPFFTRPRRKTGINAPAELVPVEQLIRLREIREPLKLSISGGWPAEKSGKATSPAFSQSDALPRQARAGRVHSKSTVNLSIQGNIFSQSHASVRLRRNSQNEEKIHAYRVASPNFA